jgi:hypothetical protein
LLDRVPPKIWTSPETYANSLETKTLLLAFCAVIAVIPTTGAARPLAANTPAAGEPSSDDQEKTNAKADSKADSEEEAEEESAPAPLEIDVSNSSPLIRELYQATRETKEKAILERLANAKKLLDDGRDVKATDPKGGRLCTGPFSVQATT